MAAHNINYKLYKKFTIIFLSSFIWLNTLNIRTQIFFYFNTFVLLPMLPHLGRCHPEHPHHPPTPPPSAPNYTHTFMNTESSLPSDAKVHSSRRKFMKLESDFAGPVIIFLTEKIPFSDPEKGKVMLICFNVPRRLSVTALSLSSGARYCTWSLL
jgi:hypothetical protein